MASNNIARLGVVLGLDTAEFTASIDKAISENKKLSQAIKRDTNNSVAVLNDLKNATDDYGKTLNKVTLMEREMAGGRLKFATDDMKDKILAQAAAYDAVVAAATKRAEIAEKAKSIDQQEQLATKHIQELKFATEDYGQTLTKVAQIQREVSSGKFSEFSKENKEKLLEEAAAYDKVVAAAKHKADVIAAADKVKQQNQPALTELQNLKNATDDYGKTLTKVQIIEREITSGRLQGAGADVKAQLLAQAAAYDKVAASAHKAAGGLTAWQKQGLAYQTTDFFTQVASGQNVLIAAIQQGGQLKDQMGGLGNMFRVLTPLVFSVTGAMVAVGAGIGVAAFAAYSGRKEFDALTNSIILTGNYSKVTTDDFGKMASTIANTSRASIGDAKDILNAMIGSGQFTNKTFDSVSKTIQRFSELSGLTSKEAAAKLIPALDGSASSAKKLNDQYNFLTLEQYKHIEALEKQGKIQESIIYTSDLLKQSFGNTTKELGYIDTALDYTTKKWSEFWNAAMNLGKPDTPQEKLKKIQDELENVRKSKFISAGLGSNIASQEKFEAKKNARIQELEAEKDALQENIRLAAKKNDLTGEKEKIDKRAKDGGASAEFALVQQYEKAKRDLKYANLMSIADEETRIIYDSAHKQEDLYAQYLSDIKDKDKELAGIRYETYIAEMQKEMVERENRMDDYRQKELNKTIDAAQAERFARQKIEDEENNKRLERLGEYTNKYYASQDIAAAEKDKLEAQIKMVGMSEKQVKLAELEAKYQEDIARNILESKGDKAVLDQWNKLAEAKKNDAKLNIELTEQLTYMKEVNDTVWKDMTSALDEFVNTGSLNFSKLTQSILQDLLKIQIKKQALALFETASGGGGMMGLVAAGATLLGFASGGEPPVNQVSMVGERGPELFVPKTAGTIIPNNMLKGNDSGPTINYNGPYIANMNAIDTQSGVAFLAKNKQAIWATYQSANRSIPMSR